MKTVLDLIYRVTNQTVRKDMMGEHVPKQLNIPTPNTIPGRYRIGDLMVEAMLWLRSMKMQILAVI